MADVQVDGLRIRYRVDGDGPPVVLLHGIARTHADWTAQHELLSDRFRVHSVDLPGFGGSDPLPGRYSLQALAAFVERFLDAVGVTEPAHLVGNSLGGAIAMRVSVLAPQRVRSLALVNSAGSARKSRLPCGCWPSEGWPRCCCGRRGTERGRSSDRSTWTRRT
jgi:pimeloyl-ACP methyl ester carboxylesterase